jgi:hypothetical protein
MSQHTFSLTLTGAIKAQGDGQMPQVGSMSDQQLRQSLESALEQIKAQSLITGRQNASLDRLEAIVVVNDKGKAPTVKPTHSHAFDIAFELKTACDNGESATAQQLREALIQRILSLDDDDLISAVGAPFDTHELES